MSWSSLCVINGGPARLDMDQYTVYGEQAGIDFIQLRHGLGAARGAQQLRGFQKTVISRRESSDGHISWKVIHSKDEDGNDRSGRVNLKFYNEFNNGILYAYVPDTQWNRRRLTSTFALGADWIITDKKIEEEIKQEYIKLNSEPPKPRMSKSDSEKVSLLREIEDLRSLNEEALADRDEAEADRDKAQMSEQEIKDKVLPYIDKGDDLVPVEFHRHAKLLTKKYMVDFKKIAKEAVHEKNKETIDRLVKEGNKNYWLCNEYIDGGIKGEIEQYYKDGIEGYLTAKWRRPWNEHGPIIDNNNTR